MRKTTREAGFPGAGIENIWNSTFIFYLFMYVFYFLFKLVIYVGECYSYVLL